VGGEIIFPGEHLVGVGPHALGTTVEGRFVHLPPANVKRGRGSGIKGFRFSSPNS
jgi:hypothetical protein